MNAQRQAQHRQLAANGIYHAVQMALMHGLPVRVENLPSADGQTWQVVVTLTGVQADADGRLVVRDAESVTHA